MKKTMFTGFIITIIIIMIIFYLIVNIKQPYVSCNVNHVDDLGIRYNETVRSQFSSKSISKIEIVRIITVPDKYNNETNINAINYALKRSYKYLGKDVKFKTVDNEVIMKISTTKNLPIILNNMEFYDQDGLGIKIDTNTKSSENANLSIGDKYSEGEYMVFMKGYEYSCK
ncbi:MAG: hypothetical protein IJI43_00590 [Bacilli bacterium]|nr:hypothetical protein [Bacilli bacterium]